jgi:hypothetical protein
MKEVQVMAVVESPIYREIYRFLASGPTDEQILAFHPPEATSDRLRELVTRARADVLTPEEQIELDEFEQVEHLVRMLKLHTLEMMG